MNTRRTELHSAQEIAAILLLLFTAMLDPRLTVALSAVMITALILAGYPLRRHTR